MKKCLCLLGLFIIHSVSNADTIRDFTKYGIFIKTDGKTIKSKKLTYGMEIDFSPKAESMTVYRYDKEGNEEKIATIPTSANQYCSKKIKRIGCNYTVGSKGPVHSVSKKYNCMKVCQ